MKKQATNYPPGMVIFPNDQMEKYKEYMEKTKGMSQKQVLSELMKAKAAIPKETLDKHVKNLDALSQTEGFFSEQHRARIPRVKQMLLSGNVATNPGSSKESDVEGQFWGIGSSWLWWLILASIWGGGYWGGYYGYPY